uniref:Phorbol-12-myristate-13-acetate-induced protein 1 n=2 Tax=Theropithecus gelada TaxID=9565 RepID=A0A8D2JU22_THEGE
HPVYLAVPRVRAVDPGTPARGSVRVQLASCRRPTCSSWRPRFPGSVAEWAAAPAEMPGKKARKNVQPSPTRAQAELEVECATQLRRFGDKLNFRQKLLNLIAKLFCSGT